MNEIDIMQQFGNMGIGGILLFMVVKEWLIFQKRKADGFSYSDMAKKLDRIDARTEHVSREVAREEVLKQLTLAIQEQTRVFSEVIITIRNTNDEIRRMDSELRDIRRDNYKT